MIMRIKIDIKIKINQILHDKIKKYIAIKIIKIKFNIINK